MAFLLPLGSPFRRKKIKIKADKEKRGEGC